MKWLSELGSKALLIIAVVVLVSAFLTVRSCKSASTANTETKLAIGQANASIESGGDAVNTVGNRAASDASTDRTTMETTDAIRNTPGADVAVPPALNDVGLRGLCRYDAYRSDPKCLRFTPAR